MGRTEDCMCLCGYAAARWDGVRRGHENSRLEYFHKTEGRYSSAIGSCS